MAAEVIAYFQPLEAAQMEQEKRYNTVYLTDEEAAHLADKYGSSIRVRRTRIVGNLPSWSLDVAGLVKLSVCVSVSALVGTLLGMRLCQS